MSAHQYEKASEALKDLNEAYNYWTSRLSESSVTFSLGLIAANWAIFGHEGLRSLTLPRLSIALALLTLLVSTGAALWMAHLHDVQHDRAETRSSEWEKEFKEAKRSLSSNPWPYTRAIERVGFWSRVAKFVLPLVAGLLFICSFDAARNFKSGPKERTCAATSGQPA